MCAKYFDDEVSKDKPTSNELNMLYTIMLYQCPHRVWKKFGIESAYGLEIYQAAAMERNRIGILREWLRNQMESIRQGILSGNSHLAAASLVLSERYGEEYRKALESANKKAQARKLKIAKELDEMGYGTDGKRLPEILLE